MHVRATVLGNALGNSIVDGMAPKAPQFGPTRQEMDDLYAEIDAGARKAMGETDALVQRDLKQYSADLEFEHRIEVQGRLAAREMNESLLADIQRSVKAPQIRFAPEMDAVTRAEYAARGGTIDFMSAQTQAIANGAEVGHEAFRGAGASGSWAYGGASGSWDEPMSGYDKFRMTAHTGLAVAGAIPVLGLIPDTVDFLYTAGEMPFGKSNGVDLGLAGVGIAATLLPVGVDQAAAAAKIAARTSEMVGDASHAAKATPEIVWPPNRGFADNEGGLTTVLPGQTLDRHGGTGGSFLSPAGTPSAARSLAPGAELRPLRSYEVLKPFEAKAGYAAPWFNQPGGGLQFDLEMRTVQDLIDAGILRPKP